MEKDLTRGSSFNLILGLALPQILSAILQQLYSSADALIVGNYIGQEALGGIGLSTPITTLLLSLVMGMSSGVAVIVGQYFGAKNYKKIKSIMQTALISLGLLSVLLSLGGILVTDPLLRMISTPEPVFVHASSYIKIYLMGTIFTMVYNLYFAVLRAIGDVKSPLIFLVISACLNIFLDIYFVLGLGLGAGACALATVIAQGLSSVLIIFYIRKRVPILSIEFTKIRFFPSDFRLIRRYGLPPSIQMSIRSLGTLATQNILNSYGVSALAGYSSAVRVDSFIIMPYENIGLALSSFTGQNIGARKYARVQKGLRASFTILIVTSLVLCPLVYIFSDKLVLIFIEDYAHDALAYGSQMLRYLSFMYIFLGLFSCLSGLLRGSGDNNFALYGSIFSILARIVATYGLNYLIGIRSVWLGQGIGWISGFVFLYLRYKSNGWKDKGLID